MDLKSMTRSAAGYQGLAYILWGSWRIAGQASIAGEPPDDPGGTFVVDSDDEPMLLSILAGALHESYRLRLGEEDDHREPVDITIVGHEGNRINFALRG